MRKYRRFRSRYRNREKKKAARQILLRILFVLLCIALFTFLAVLLGEHLRERAAFAEITEATTTETYPPTEEEEIPYPDGILSSSEASKTKICAADIDVTVGEPDDIYKLVEGLPELYNAVSIRIVRDGRLIYTPQSLLEYFRLDPTAANTQADGSDRIMPPDEPYGETDESETNGEKNDTPLTDASSIYANLMKALDTAKERDLRVCAVYTTDPSVILDTDDGTAQRMIDKTIVGELLSIGFDEVTINGLVGEDDVLNSETLEKIISYLATVRGEGLSDIGVQLPSDVYLTPQSAAAVNTISKYADFLSVGISSGVSDADEAYSLTYDNYYSLKGSFSVYGLRGIILDGDPSVASAVYAALNKLSVPSVLFAEYSGEPSYVPDGADSEPSNTTVSNDNAMRSEDYLNPEPEE